MAFFLEAPYFLVFAVLLFAHQLPRRIRWIAGVESGVLLSAIALSFSRGAWLSTALGHVAVLLRGTRHQLGAAAVALALALAVLGIAWGTNPHFLSRLQTKLTITSGTSSSVRYTALAKSWEAIRQDPLIGIGAGNFAETLRVPAGRGILAHPHNAYVQTWLEQGLLGLLSFVFLLGAPIISFWRRARTDAPSMELRIGFCLVLSVYAVHFLFTSFHASLFFWVIYGLGVSLWALDTPRESPATSLTSTKR
jgi:O-antigen ligase